MSALAILKVLDTTLFILERQQRIREAFQSTRNEIQTMVDEGREPTEAEWALLETRLNNADQSLDDRADEARRLVGDG